MEFQIVRDDPLHVLSSTKAIVESLEYIEIDEKKIGETSKVILEKLKEGPVTLQMDYGGTGNLGDDVQLIFLEAAVNFCFWAEKGKPKWEVDWPKGRGSTGGWYSLTKCFQRALSEKIPILDSEYLSQLSRGQVRSLFKGTTDVEIPLIEKRMENLQEAGRVLKKKYDGKFINALEQAKFDAIAIAKVLISDFPSFRDISTWNQKKIYFLKRAQICAQDFSYVTHIYKSIKIKNIDLLTAFADYKIPQMLRKFNVIIYSNKLAEKIDNYILIPTGSREEIEIRSATIWCIELIRQRLEEYMASDIDNALWLISQDQTNVKPYHRTYSIFY